MLGSVGSTLQESLIVSALSWTAGLTVLIALSAPVD
jgi:hypothetical protein